MKYKNVSCSQCGQSFGAGDHGFSHCSEHRQDERRWVVVDNMNDVFDDNLDFCESLAGEDAVTLSDKLNNGCLFTGDAALPSIPAQLCFPGRGESIIGPDEIAVNRNDIINTCSDAGMTVIHTSSVAEIETKIAAKMKTLGYELANTKKGERVVTDEQLREMLKGAYSDGHCDCIHGHNDTLTDAQCEKYTKEVLK